MHRHVASVGERIDPYRLFRAFVTALCLAITPAAIAGQVVQHRFVSERPDAEFEDILYLAAGIELSNAGYSSTKEAKGATHILVTTYEVAGGKARIRFEFSEATAPSRVLASVEVSLPIDMSIDSAIAKAIRPIVDRARADRKETGGKAAGIAGVLSPGAAKEKLRTKKMWRVESVASGGGTLFIGDFSDYAGFGVTGAFQAGELFLRKNWSLSAGPRFTVTKAFNASGVTGASLYLSTAALNLQCGLGAAKRQRLAACASAGAAVLTVSEDGRVMSKTVPCADVGAQAGLPIGKDFFLGGEARFFAVFDPDILIMGTTATLAIHKEF